MMTNTSGKTLHAAKNLKPQSTKQQRGVVAIAAAAALLAGCTLAPTYERPAAPVATQWPTAQPAAQAASAASAAAAPQGAAGIAAADMPWQDFVQDARLREIVELTLQNNRDLRIAVKNIELAQAQYRINRADLAPTLGANASGSRTSPNPAAAAGGPSVATSYAAGFGINSWEIDLFGRIRSMSNSASAKYLATEEARKAAQISPNQPDRCSLKHMAKPASQHRATGTGAAHAAHTPANTGAHQTAPRSRRSFGTRFATSRITCSQRQSSRQPAATPARARHQRAYAAGRPNRARAIAANRCQPKCR